MRRRGVGKTLAVVIVVAALAISGVAVYELTNETPANSVKMMMEFSPQSYDSAYYYGVSQGFYRNNGFNLTLLPGKNSGTSISAVSTGAVQFGLVDTSALVIDTAKSNITNVKIVAITFERNYFAVIYNEAYIHTISDLGGKTAGATSPTSGGAETNLFFLLAKDNGINASSIDFQYASASVYAPQIATGKVQFILSTGHTLPSLQAAAAQNGITLGAFYFPDYGVDTYGEALITSTQMIAQHSDEVRRFVQATMESIQAGEGNPSQAVASLVAAQPQLNYTSTLAGYDIDLSCCARNGSGITNPLELGWIDPLRMQQTVTTVVTGVGIETPVNASSLYTDAYVIPPPG